MKTKNFQLCRPVLDPHYRLIEFDDDYYLLDTINGIVFEIDDFSTFILLFCDGNNSLFDIKKKVLNKLNGLKDIEWLIEISINYLFETGILLKA